MINWVSVGFITIYHLIGLIGFFYININQFFLGLMISMVFFSGFGITMGYHRLWSHRSFKAKPILQAILALAGASAIQGSCIWWSRYHRLHHYRSDTEDDPYGPQKGFWYSHILWIFENRNINALKKIDISDLKSNPILKFQHNYYPFIALFGSIGVPFIITLLYYKTLKLNLIFQTIVYPIAIARIITWHTTWFVNSLAHSLGEKTYGNSNTSRDNMITAFLTLGEGYHNFHHEFPFDWRNAIKWYQYDPTKWLIKLCYYMGLTYDLKEAKAEVILMNQFDQKQFVLLAQSAQSAQSAQLTQSGLSIDQKQNIQIKSNTEYPTYTDSDISKLNFANIIIYENQVFDLTPLFGYHPGGDMVIKSIINKPESYIKSQMNKINNHTQGAINLLYTMKIANYAK